MYENLDNFRGGEMTFHTCHTVIPGVPSDERPLAPSAIRDDLAAQDVDEFIHLLVRIADGMPVTDWDRGDVRSVISKARAYLVHLDAWYATREYARPSRPNFGAF